MRKILLFIVLLLAAMLFANAGPDLADQAVQSDTTAPSRTGAPDADPQDAAGADRPAPDSEEASLVILLHLLAHPTP